MKKIYNKNNIKVLFIGQKLSSELFYIVNNMAGDGEREYWEKPLNDFYYTLYNFSFENGLNFNFHNKEQRNIENNLHKISYSVKKRGEENGNI